MDTKFNRTGHLRQIPVLALRNQLKGLMRDQISSPEIVKRIKQALKKSSVRDPERTISNLTRDDLVRIINKCPEIDDAQIQALFEEYRYGANPSFYIYLFHPGAMGRRETYEIRLPFTKRIEEFNRNIPKDKPRLRNLISEGLFEIEGCPEVIEGNYRYQRRVDLIDEYENATSLYETVYGFFWINIEKGYVVIQAHDRAILHHLRAAIEDGADMHMTPLFITKALKKSLSFLIPNMILSSRLHEPNPNSERFHWVSIRDDSLSRKGYYENWEEVYPEVSTARYKIEINGGKPGDIIQRTLAIDLDDGSMSLAGKLTASQFRAWALDTLATIIETIEGFKKTPRDYVSARKFNAIPELRIFQPIQREHITNIVALLMELMESPGIGSRDIELSPLRLAKDLGKWVDVQFRMPCQNESCTAEGYFLCPSCKDSQFFHVLEFDGKWYLQCAKEKRNQWYMPLPFTTKCEQGHELDITQTDLESWIEILPHRELLQTIADYSKYMPGFQFIPEIETFVVRGRNLVHYDDKAQAPTGGAGRVTVIIRAGNVEKGGKIVGVQIPREKRKAKSTLRSTDSPQGMPRPA